MTFATLPRLLIVAALQALLLSSCFTGVESTPKVTAGDLKRENVSNEPTAEARFAEQFAPQSPSAWKPGREFKVTDDRISLIFSSVATDKLPSAGDTIRYAGISEVASVFGTPGSLLLLTTAAGDTLPYRRENPPEEILKLTRMEIPFCVDLAAVGHVDSLLRGLRLYITTSDRNLPDMERTTGRKFIAVTVDSVTAGSADFPLMVRFTEDDGSRAGILMSASQTANARSFAKLFAMSDPRLFYPAITDAVWRAIVEGRVLPEMTRDEVRLSLGTPSEVIHGRTYSALREQWIYPNGLALIFEDGLLKWIR